MKKILLVLLILGLAVNSFASDEWAKDEPLGTRNISDLDTYIGVNNEALDRMLANYRQGAKLVYLSAATVTVQSGELMCSNAGGTVRKMRKNPSNTTVTWANIDQGAEGSATTYYIYAVADADAETFTVIISANSSTPQGGQTYYKRLGSFYNDGSSNVTLITNDTDYFVKYFEASTGVTSHGGTVALIDGYTAAQCDVTVSGSDIGPAGSSSEGYRHFVSINGSRVVTAYAYNSVYGSSTNGTANHLIVCYR